MGYCTSIGTKSIVSKRYFVIRTPYDSVSTAYFTAAGITDPIEKRAVNNFVLSCKANTNIWNSLTGGFVYLVSPTSYGASLYNLMSTSFYPIAGVSPSYSTNGWSFNGSTQYLRTQFLPSTSMTINTGFSALYVRSVTASSTFALGSSVTGGGSQWSIGIRGATDLATFNAYNSATTFTTSNANNTGTYVFGILANNSRYIRRNGVSIGTSSATVGGGLPAFELHIGARNVNGSAASFCQIELSTVVTGLIGLSTSDADLLRTYIDTYNLNVISGGR